MTTLKRWTGTAWEPVGLPNGGSPVGILGSAQATANTPSITGGEYEPVGCSISVTVPAGRLLRVVFDGQANASVAGNRIKLHLKKDGAYLNEREFHLEQANIPYGVRAEFLTSPSAGAHRYHMTAAMSAGTGNVWLSAGATEPYFMYVEDVTPTPQPANTSPSSTLAYSESPNATHAIANGGDVPGLTATVTVAAGRRLRITAQVHLRSSVATDTVYARLVEDGTNKGFSYLNELASSPNTGIIEQIVTPSAGTHTYKIQGHRQVGSGNLTVYSGPPHEPSWILVEDITGTTIDGGALTTLQTAVQDSGWITPTLLNGWINYDANNYSPARYRKVGNIVYVSGLVKNGTVGTDIFILPVGFRPLRNMHWPAVTNAAFGILEVTQTTGTPGAVKCNAGSNAWFSIETSFMVD